ncbi:MAG: gfo/Idh/MocA family oxidoreductase [Candidatus Omnitrophota bacterium]|jgi:predicted dehydrogenase|nr:MAG: gfo/Idh/MocA family oxidoreductase [Candidatus Omnitrophota bacterium]
MKSKSTRRAFVQETATVGAGIAVMTSIAPQSVIGANERLRIAGIGTGDRGTDRLRTAKRLGAEIVALADVNEAMLDRCDARLEQKTDRYCDYQELLARDDIDGVIAAPPDHWHHDVLIDAITAKKDVYIEKPLSRTIEEGQSMVNAVKASDRIVQVGNHRRSGEHWAIAHDIVAGGEIGDIKWIRTWDCRYRLIDPYQDRVNDKDLFNPERIDWQRFLGSAPSRPFDAERCSAWRWFWDYAGGLMTDIGPHMLDVAMWITDCRGPKSVVCNGGNYHYPRWETPDNVHAILDCATFSIVFNVQFMNGFEGDGCAYYGVKGSVIQERDGFFRQYGVDNKMVNEWKMGDEGTAHMQNFLDCIRSRKQPNSPVEMGHRVLIGAHLANISYRAGKRVGWDPIHEKFV